MHIAQQKLQKTKELLGFAYIEMREKNSSVYICATIIATVKLCEFAGPKASNLYHTVHGHDMDLNRSATYELENSSTSRDIHNPTLTLAGARNFTLVSTPTDEISKI